MTSALVCPTVLTLVAERATVSGIVRVLVTVTLSAADWGTMREDAALRAAVSGTVRDVVVCSVAVWITVRVFVIAMTAD